MIECPKCKKQTLKTKANDMSRPKSIGECYSPSVFRSADEWSLCSERCTDPECNYIK